MKLILTLFVVLTSYGAIAEETAPEKIMCSIKHSKAVIAVAEKHSTYDKNRHCTVSCMLGLRCNLNEVMLVGVLKEFKDLFGPGNAERDDLIADKYGVDLVRHKRATTDSECLEQCDLKY